MGLFPEPKCVIFGKIVGQLFGSKQVGVGLNPPMMPIPHLPLPTPKHYHFNAKLLA
jgi:hypothetical protein